MNTPRLNPYFKYINGDFGEMIGSLMGSATTYKDLDDINEDITAYEIMKGWPKLTKYSIDRDGDIKFDPNNLEDSLYYYGIETDLSKNLDKLFPDNIIVFAPDVNDDESLITNIGRYMTRINKKISDYYIVYGGLMEYPTEKRFPLIDPNEYLIPVNREEKLVVNSVRDIHVVRNDYTWKSGTATIKGSKVNWDEADSLIILVPINVNYDLY